MKGISPLVASVLLIAITMAVAAVLATWVTSFTEETTSAFETSCIGGRVTFDTADYPKWTAGTVTAVIKATGVPLGDFKFVVLFNDDTTVTYSDTGGLSLSPGSVGTIVSEATGAAEATVNKVKVLTNCSTVETSWAALR